MIFRQLFDKNTNTYSYLLADSQSLDAVIIDPVREQFQRDYKLIEQMNLKLKYILETHIHADHITSAALLKEATGAQTAISSHDGSKNFDTQLNDKQILEFGRHKITCLKTVGHTNSCMSFLVDNMIFSGDALMIRSCGRTDFQNGSNKELFNSVRNILFKLPDHTLVYPAHNYEGFTNSTILEEKNYNPRLKLTNNFSDFACIMDNLNLSLPKNIKVNIKINQNIGKI